jgi:hypothetical protein
MIDHPIVTHKPALAIAEKQEAVILLFGASFISNVCPEQMFAQAGSRSKQIREVFM